MAVMIDIANILPKGWATERLGNILPLSYGKALSGKNRDSSGSYPVYGSSGIVGCHTEYLTSKPCLIVGRNGSAGNVFYSEKPCWPIDTAYYSEESSLIELRYFLYLLSHIRLDQVDNSTAIPSLSRDVYNQIEVPFAPLNEQKRIVSKIEELFSKIEEGERCLNVIAPIGNKALGLAVNLRQSILKQAFTGRLVPQDATDEPANKLLKRIQVERSNIVKTSIKRSKKPNKETAI